MSKTNKELAIDVAIAYINNIYPQVSTSAGTQTQKLSVDTCCRIIQDVYNTLESLDSDNNK